MAKRRKRVARRSRKSVDARRRRRLERTRYIRPVEHALKFMTSRDLDRYAYLVAILMQR
jgi:hypothetical protein